LKSSPSSSPQQPSLEPQASSLVPQQNPPSIGPANTRVPHVRTLGHGHRAARDRSRGSSVRHNILLIALVATPLTAAALLPPWLQHIRANAAFEAALYRVMSLPGAQVFFPRPPKESIAELNKLPASPALYSLRAQQEEQALDFTAAESDWKAFASQSPNNKLQLADFYHRRNAVKPEFATLLEIAATPSPEPFTPPAQQQSWQAFERALTLADDQSFDDSTTLALYKSWIARYPQQPTIYARAFTWSLDQHRFPDAESILAQYRTAFPTDQVFPIKATALLALRRGDTTKALAVYDAAFQPLWPDALVSSYLSLLSDTHNLRHFIADANARLQRNPDDLNALGRIFLYNQNQQHTDAALDAVDAYRRNKETRSAPWTATELDTLAQLTLAAHDAPDSARYDFALHSQSGNLPDGRDAKATGLSNMIALLLSTPDQPITLGAGNLSMYRDIATLDQGPGYWNGILSLWLNSQSPSDQFAQEEKKAQPYFQRAKAAELLVLLDREAPTAPQRPALHAQLLQVYADYCDNAAVIHEGTALLTEFPNADATFRLNVAMAMADAYARQNDTASEFALYDRTLAELGARAQNMPLTAASMTHAPTPETPEPDASTPAPKTPDAAPAFQLDTGAPAPTPHPEADAYAQLLDRYLGRLTSAQKLPQALAVLRKELDRNPNDPLLYEKLATFLGQNNLSAQEEEVYRQAIGKFQDPTWTDKLARFYLRFKRNQDYAALTRKVTDTFEGTDLDAYFNQNSGGGPQLFLELNLYAHQRFPHDIVFTQNLLGAYTNKDTLDRAAWEKLLRETWWQSPDLTRQFFEFLSRTGKLDAELAQIQPTPTNPAAQQEAAEAQLWRSHFEESAPLFADLSASYPADVAIGDTASDLQRSLAWFDPTHTATSVAIEQRLLAANPADLSRLARIGDILADHADDSAASLAPAAAYWHRMSATAPGDRDTYLQAATVFWDYFQFDDALTEIAAARAHFHEPALFGYEAGAIAEGKRDYPLAVHEYIAAALTGDTDDDATTRLLQLARRASTHDLIDSQTAAAATDPNGLTLRLKILAVQHRSAEAAPLLLSALKSAKTAEAAAGIADLARNHDLPAVYDQALTREADLTTDPVERLQLQYTLAQAYEDRKDIANASRLIDTLYKENPLLLGIVRSTVDFDWRNKRQPQAITVLVTASHAAQPELAHQFTAEAAQKANESGDTRQARTLAESLLQLDPYNAQYLSLAADSYIRANDNSGLKQFYLTRLDLVRTTNMSADDRKARTALLRKGFIPALTRGKDFAGAVDQYIALISAYPEDTGLNNEAALYALRNGRKQQYIGFLQTTTKASPRDSRFFIDLAQAQNVFGDLPAAIDAYAHAVAIRKDRTDIYTAKAALEETLQRFDDAAADYKRLYQLTYKDPQWMVAIARVRARQGRADDAATSLKTAYLTGPKQVPHDFFQIASQLEQWNFLDQATIFAEQGRSAAGDRFFTADASQVDPGDPATFARILTRQRHAPAALAAFHDALTPATAWLSSPTLVVAQIQSQGVAAVTDSDWRKQQAAARQQQAEATYARALTAIGTAVDAFYTPEERAAYATLLDRQRTGATPKQLTDFWIPAAHAAGLLEKESAWRKELLLTPGDSSLAQLQPYIDLQRSRMAFNDLGQTLEAFIKVHPKSAAMALTSAADAYHDAGDVASETRILRSANLRDYSQSALRDRYLDLLLHHNTAALIALAGSRTESLADAAANLAVAKASPTVALAAVNARGKALPAVWAPSTTGLTYLYLADTSGKGDAAFRTALASEATIAERLATKPNTARQLTGQPWFYHAARDGQLRLLAPATQPAAEDLLAADLEYSANTTSYNALAQTYVEAGNPTAALAELDHVLELDPHSADTQDTRALILWNAGRHDEAIASWRDAFASLRIIEDRAAAPETFWSGFARIARHLHDHGLATQLKPQMDDVLRVYLTRNGNYRSNELLQAAFTSQPDPVQGADWIIALASNAIDPLSVLYGIDNALWLPRPARETILLHEIQLIKSSPTTAQDYSNSRFFYIQDELVKLYAARGEYARALTLFRTTYPVQRPVNGVLLEEVILASHAGQLDALLVQLRSQPDNEYTASDLKTAAKELANDGNWQQSRAVLELIFEHALSAHTLASTDYLALTEARLHTNDLDGAVALLNSLAQTSGDTYANLDSAAALLEKNAQPAAAIAFLTTLARSVPWDLSYRVRLAEAQQHAKQSQPEALATLAAVAHNPLAPYAFRTRAALDLTGTSPADLGSAELNLLASPQNGVPHSSGSLTARWVGPNLSPAAAQQPFFVAARILAASQSHDANQQAALLREAIAITPNTPQILFDLFHAELSRKESSATRAALDALLKTPTSSEPDFLGSSILDDISSQEADPTVGGQYYAPQPALAAALSKPDRAKLAIEFAEVFRHDGDDHNAIAYFKLALHLDPSDSTTIPAKIAAIEAAQRLEAANAARRPTIHKALDQPLIVRSRLTVAPDEAPAPAKEQQ
jgi:cellulose synthase operon protein C